MDNLFFARSGNFFFRRDTAVVTAGIVAEYNPFHRGHAHQIARTRAELGPDCAVVAVMSGSWVQGGRPAVLDKWARARLALLGGVDLVLELPTVWAVSSAEAFARGAVELLALSQVVDVLSFGSECGDIAPLCRLACCLNTPRYEAGVRRLLAAGLPFAAARQRAVGELLGEGDAALLSAPNNNLGVEYLRNLERDGWTMGAVTVRREGAPHDSVLGECAVSPVGGVASVAPPFLSATQLRLFLERGDWGTLEPYLPEGGLEVLRAGWNGFPSLVRAERAVLARLRTMAAEDWARLPDSGAGEGLPPRLERAGRQCRSLEEFFALAKPRHWTRARLRRLLVWAWLGLTQGDRPDIPPYLRVLAFNGQGRSLLREMKGRASLPILTKPAHIRGLSGSARALFELESRCTDLYDLCLETVPAPGREWTTGPVILE